MAKTERKPLRFDPDDTGAAAASEERETSSPPPARTRAKPQEQEQRQQLGARVTTAAYRKLKVRAAVQGVTIAALVEQAIGEFLANHPD